MSINNLNNSEHRGQFNTFPPSIRRHNCCSFCRQPGHNVTTCNSSRLREFEAICATKALQTNTPDDFKNWLSQNYMEQQQLLKAFSQKKFRVTRIISIENCIDLITDYIFIRYKNTNESGEIIEFADIIEEDLITLFMIQMLSSVRQEDRIISENQQIRSMETMLMREMNDSTMAGLNHTSTREYNRNFQINSIFNENKNKDENKICECSICYDEKELHKFVKFGCNHEFCNDCVINTMKTSNNNKLYCALCRTEVREIKSRTEEVKSEFAIYIQ